MSGVNLKGEWDHLDSETRQWLLGNPGCLILAHSLSARVCERAATPVEWTKHGQIELSRAIWISPGEKAEAAGTIRAAADREYRFFDSTS